MKPFTAYQETVNEEILRSLDGLELSSARLEHELLRTDAERLSRQRRDDMALAETKAALAALRERGDELSRGQDVLRAVGPALTERLDEVAERLDDLARRLDLVESYAQAIPYMEGAPFQLSQDPVAGVVQGFRNGANGTDSDVYRSFEDIFRGSEEFIRNRQRRYLAIVAGHQPVLDFGCGRGEFLDLLRDREIEYRGVDSDPGMVARCREKGHASAVLADGLAYLDDLDDASQGAIFCAQVVEHFEYETIVRFLELAQRKLQPGGLLIAETVNPHSPPALKAFWVDLTHKQPIFPEVALALCKTAGFASAYVFHPNGTGDVDRDRFVQGEYAVVAAVGDKPEKRAARASSATTDQRASS
jgi:SAM-dependent methyltransferase